MSEITYLFRGRKTSGSPEKMQKHFEKWVTWFKELGAAGRLKDPGHPLEGHLRHARFIGMRKDKKPREVRR